MRRVAVQREPGIGTGKSTRAAPAVVLRADLTNRQAPIRVARQRRGLSQRLLGRPAAPVLNTARIQSGKAVKRHTKASTDRISCVCHWCPTGSVNTAAGSVLRNKLTIGAMMIDVYANRGVLQYPGTFVDPNHASHETCQWRRHCAKNDTINKCPQARAQAMIRAQAPSLHQCAGAVNPRQDNMSRDIADDGRSCDSRSVQDRTVAVGEERRCTLHLALTKASIDAAELSAILARRIQQERVSRYLACLRRSFV